MYGRRFASHSSGVTRAMAAEAAQYGAQTAYTLTLHNGHTFVGVASIEGRREVACEPFRRYINNLSETEYRTARVFVAGEGWVPVRDIAKVSE